MSEPPARSAFGGQVAWRGIRDHVEVRDGEDEEDKEAPIQFNGLALLDLTATTDAFDAVMGPWGSASAELLALIFSHLNAIDPKAVHLYVPSVRPHRPTCTQRVSGAIRIYARSG